MKQQARSIMHLIVAETFPKLFFVAFNSGGRNAFYR
jgi:hypothetical protein